MNDAYITGLGRFLPGEPIPSDEVDDFLGPLGPGAMKLRDRVIANSGIKTRHYALDRERKSTHSSAGMAAEAIREALADAEVDVEDVDLISTASSLPDLLVPGLASMVHGELGIGACETQSSSGICCAGAQALKQAYMQVRYEGKQAAVASSVEFTSRILKDSWLTYSSKHGKKMTMDGAFLRYILSDGAGAAVVQPQPTPGVNLRIDWITHRSYAPTGDAVMYCGTDGPDAERSWLDYTDPEEAARNGALAFRQDLRRLPEVVRICVDEHDRLVREGVFNPEDVKYLAAHYSSEIMKQAALREFESRGGRYVPAERWRSNLPTVGNIGTAAIYVILDELVASGELEDGDQVLCFVPESGRYSISYMMMSAVCVPQPAEATAREAAAAGA